MFLSGLSESGYLSNALLTKLISVSIPILVYMESICMYVYICMYVLMYVRMYVRVTTLMCFNI